MRWPTRLPVQLAKRFEETVLAVRQLPMREALIHKRRTKADQDFMHQGVAVFANGLQQNIPMPSRHGSDAPSGRGFKALHAAVTDSPQRLQRKCLPLAPTPMLER